MSKFEKRLKKTLGNTSNALVLGTGFGELPRIVSIFKNVFVINNTPPEIKAKNLIYRLNFDDLSPMADISSIFVDRCNVEYLSRISTMLERFRPTVIIEGNDVIDHKLCPSLYNHMYRATEQQGIFHIWRQIK